MFTLQELGNDGLKPGVLPEEIFRRHRLKPSIDQPLPLSNKLGGFVQRNPLRPQCQTERLDGMVVQLLQLALHSVKLRKALVVVPHGAVAVFITMRHLVGQRRCTVVSG